MYFVKKHVTFIFREFSIGILLQNRNFLSRETTLNSIYKLIGLLSSFRLNEPQSFQVRIR